MKIRLFSHDHLTAEKVLTMKRLDIADSSSQPKMLGYAVQARDVELVMHKGRGFFTRLNERTIRPTNQPRKKAVDFV
jgi:hypothetical protein